ncbi:MAG: phosphatase PAP2 family protein [Bacteroidota bacterium]|nr:phosphatase PAP2 family protein [Bacteroidota bacterium]MDP4247129.1 phosphatase PAP2 family protein [Bacteroidota bacterium]MDP4252377.1 phosphatase PAP2 family protein [Bacteroidota bacterium]MDP4257934.1 phosphatase PAP2 family protein [Bacteroidota bacterium]
MSLLNWLDHLDKLLFVLIQHDSDHPVLDRIMPVLRDPYTWIPLYALLLYYGIRKGRKKAWIFIMLSLLTFAITDSVSAQLLKPLFERPRPCYEPELSTLLRGLVDCGGLYSMPSSHAANHVGLAAFWYFSIRTMTGKRWTWLWFWAGAIGYAQVYVGKHYPLDIVAGSIFGLLTGIGMSRIFAYLWNRQDTGRLSGELVLEY